jgi:hypothetical protein
MLLFRFMVFNDAPVGLSSHIGDKQTNQFLSLQWNVNLGHVL